MNSELPNYPNAFIGRWHHIQAISGRMQEEGIRLITLLGPGGIGKTRLSLRVAEELKQHFQDGVIFVPLDTVEDAGQFGFYLAQQLDLKVQAQQDWLGEVIQYLEDKEALLILDNLEQIIEVALQIDQLIRRCPGIRILATSRIVLDISYEIEYPLDGLARPNSHLFPGPENLLKFEAIRLFVQKAQASNPSFKLTEENAACVVEICQKLDGLPLPIELAAARIKLFSPQQILERLGHSLQLLKTKSRDVISRHQTIHNTIRWSYDLLSAAEQRLFQQLAYFKAGFSLSAVEALYPETDAIELVESFLNKSLIVRQESSGLAARFRMLKLIRDFGVHQLANAEQWPSFFRAFGQYFAQLVLDGQVLKSEPSHQEWMRTLDTEYENIVLALDGLKKEQPTTAIQVGTVFWRFYLQRGYLEEGLQMTQSLLQLPIAQELDRANLLEAAGTLAQNRGNYQQAKVFFKEGLAYWKNAGLHRQIAKALTNLGWAEWRLGNYGHSRSYSENALDLSRQLNDWQGEAKAMNNLAWNYMYEGYYEKVQKLQRKILTIHQNQGFTRGIAFAKTNLGWALIRLGRLTEAMPLIKKAIDLFDEIKHTQLKTFARVIKAEALLSTSDLPAALQLVKEECIPGFKAIGDVWALGLSRMLLGQMLAKQNSSTLAIEQFELALSVYRETGDRFGIAHALICLSHQNWQSKQHSRAATLLNEGLALAAAMGAAHLLKDGYLQLAQQQVQAGQKLLALQQIAIAQHYAEILGAFQYGVFSTAIQPMVESLQSTISIPRTFLATGTHWEASDLYLAQPITEHEISTRMHQLLGNAPSATGTQAGAEDPIVKATRQLIQSHLADAKYTIANLCSDLHISHSQLHRRLQAETGLSISKFIRQIRLERAKELLADPQLTIAAVAIDTGFKDPDYFHRVFKKAFQVTPGAFRKAQLQKN